MSGSLRKVLYFDVETTGLDAKLNDIIQLSGIIEINGEIKETFNLKMQPFDWTTISSEALNVTGTTDEMLKSYGTPQKAFSDFIGLLSTYVDRYDKTDKMYAAGYNVQFDIGFLREFFLKNGDVYFGSWFSGRVIDPLYLCSYFDLMGKFSLPNYKLATVCDHLGIEIQAHDALSDIQATRNLVYKLKEFFKED